MIHISKRVRRAATALLMFLAIAAVIALAMDTLSHNSLAGVDGERFHAMASAIISGLLPYVDFVDPKPPLIYFVITAIDWFAPDGGLDIPLMAGINVLSALLIWHLGNEEYGNIAGLFAGAFYLIAAIFVQGYFLFSEQFVVLLLLLSFLLVRRGSYLAGGVLVGLAFGFKQYALLGAIPLLYLMYTQNSKRYPTFIYAIILAGALPFLLLYTIYGPTVTTQALYWTFGISLPYISGASIAEIPNYHVDNLYAFALNIIASIAFVLPAVIFALASVIRRGIRSPFEGTLVGFVLVFAGTLLIRQYLHYWILILPFLALVACREFADEK
jgi:hypothetical protein